MPLFRDALRALPGGEKAFGPGEIPVGTGSQVNSYLALPREKDVRAVVGDGLGTSIVQAIINWYLTTFPEAILEVQVPDPDSQVHVAVGQHDLTDLLENPNPFYGGDVLMAGAIISDIADGNAYILKLRNASGRVAELWWLPHTLVIPKGSKDPLGPFIEYYQYVVAGRRYEIPITEMIHLRHGMDPDDPRKGMSRLRGQLREVMTDEEAARFTAAIVANMGVPGLVVSPKGENQTVSEPDARNLEAKLDQSFGASNRGRPIVMSGATDLHQFGFSPQAMDLAGIRGVPEERLSAALGVPAAVVGFGTGLSQTKVGATMHELREMAAEQALVPLWRRFAKGLNRGLTSEFQTGGPTIRLAYNLSEVRALQEDKQKLHTRTLADVAGGVLAVDTAQGLLGYPVDDDQHFYLRPPLLTEVPAN